MSLEVKKNFLVEQTSDSQPRPLGSSKLSETIKKLSQSVDRVQHDLQELSSQKTDTTNLKNSYRQFVEDYNSNESALVARITAIEILVKNLQASIAAIEDISH